jgi:hypothetical protein
MCAHLLIGAPRTLVRGQHALGIRLTVELRRTPPGMRQWTGKLALPAADRPRRAQRGEPKCSSPCISALRGSAFLDPPLDEALHTATVAAA